ncbi:hypothetical protein NL676_027030 [Syzygium grande]|nr:hypothetical protein NL676_027030 [Syzygium grande]
MIGEGNKLWWLGSTINNLQKQKLCWSVLVRTRHGSQWARLLDTLLEGHKAYPLVAVGSTTSPSPPPRGCCFRLVVLHLVVVNLAPLAAIGSALWSWASLDSFCLVAIGLMTVGFGLSPPPCRLHHVAIDSACCRRLRLVAVASTLWSSTLPRGLGLRSSLLPLPRRLRLTAVGSALWPWAPLNLFCLVAIGLVTIGFGSLPSPRGGVGFACGRGLHLVAIGSASWRGLYS